MKKRKMKSLHLAKNVVSNLGNLSNVKGGLITAFPVCLKTDEVSWCLKCLADPSEECYTSLYNAC